MTLVELSERIGKGGDIKLTWSKLDGWRLIASTKSGTWIGQSGGAASSERVCISLDELCVRCAEALRLSALQRPLQWVSE
jgi:hypothetical protein